MASLEEIRAARLQKLETLKARGVDPYPIVSTTGPTLETAAKDFDNLKDAPLTLHGRILSIRGQGAIVFFDLHDGTGKFQVMLKKAEPTKESDFELFRECFDIGDFAEATGTLFESKQGEKTLLATSVRMLGKSLRPLPEKWEGLKDIEERFRRRYLDTLSNDEVRARFITRSKIVSKIREILDRTEYLEVETPALQPLYGGASAEPFVTHHNALDTDLYLRISDELYLKRLLAGGFPKVYEIARDFRNEGIDHTHNPEFTMLEFYEAYSDADKQRAFVEDMLRHIALLVNPSGVITYNGNQIDFTKPFIVKKYMDVFEGHDISDLSMKELDDLFKQIRPTLIDPTFLIDYPIDMLPLTKRKEGEEAIVDAFQFYAGGLELVKAFSELNDPLDQRERFINQEKVKKAGEADTQPLDEEFLEAMEYGIPPAGGVGIGIDRLTMFFTDTQNIKEVILFPTLKPKN